MTGPLSTAATAIQLVGLLAASAILLYSIVRHRERVLYAEGVGLFAGSMVLLTASAVAENVAAPRATGAAATALTYGVHVGYTAAAVGVALATWYFARDFVRYPEAEAVPEIASEEEVGGFERAD